MPIGYGELLTGFGNGLVQNVQQTGQRHLQFQDNLKLWRIQQDYNLPKNQIERLKEAKLSPHMLFGQGSVVGNTASQAPTPIDYTAAHRTSQQGIDTMLTMLQAQKIKAEIDNINANTKSTGVNTDIQSIERDYRAKTLGLNQQQQQEGINLIQLQQKQTAALTETEQARLDQVLAQTVGIKQENQYRQAVNPTLFQDAVESVMLKVAQQAEIKARMSKVPFEIRVLKAQASELRQRAASIGRDIQLKDYSIALSKIGMNDKDPVYLRLVLGQAMKDGNISGELIKQTLLGEYANKDWIRKDGPIDLGKLQSFYDYFKNNK